MLAGAIKMYAHLPHDVKIVEVPVGYSFNSLINEVAGHQPDVVGISAYIWNAGMLPGLLQRLRERLPDAVIVMGGPEASYNAGYWLEQGVGHVLAGEAELSLPTLLDKLEENRPPVFECHPVFPIDPYPNIGADGSYDGYELRGKLLYLETSRGCPFDCAFCLSAGTGVRFFPLDTVKQWLLKLSKSGAGTIKLVDRTFNCNAERAYELFEYVIGLDTTSCFHFEVAADLFNERALALLRTAPPGRIQFEAGLQSFFGPALSAASRKMDVIKAESNLRALLRAKNIHIHTDLIAGLPYETLSDFMNSFDRAYALGGHVLQLGFLKLLHGSRLREQAHLLGIIYSELPPYEIQSAPWLSARDIIVLKQAENALQHTYNKGRFLLTLEYVLKTSGYRPFSFYQELGQYAPNNGKDLTVYATQIYEFCAGLPGVESAELKDRMVYDWLGVVKGKNKPDILRNNDTRLERVSKAASMQLNRRLQRGEAAVLSSGAGVFVDSSDRDPVTGLYKVYTLDVIVENPVILR